MQQSKTCCVIGLTTLILAGCRQAISSPTTAPVETLAPVPITPLLFTATLVPTPWTPIPEPEIITFQVSPDRDLAYGQMVTVTRATRYATRGQLSA